MTQDPDKEYGTNKPPPTGRVGRAGRLQSMGSLESDRTERRHFHFSLSCIGEGNGNPLCVLAWRIPGMGELGELLSMGSHRVGHY